MTFSEFSDVTYFEPKMYDVCLPETEVDFIGKMMLLFKSEEQVTSDGVPCTYLSDVMEFVKENKVDVDSVCYVDKQGNIRPVTEHCFKLYTDDNGDSVVMIKNLG